MKSDVKEVRIVSEIVNFTLDLNTLKEIKSKVGTDVNVSAEKVTNKDLSPSAKKLVGDRPIYDLTITSKSNKTLTDFGKGKIKVSIPYELDKNEKASSLVALYIDSLGNATEVKNSVYDSKTETLNFTTDHFSKFAVGYKTVSFSDIENHWAQDSIEFVVGEGLFGGTGDGKFSPNISMTRGMFVTVLYRLSGETPVNYSMTFTDVNKDAYYAEAVRWATSEEIVKGISATEFAPNGEVTREQMAVILYNYAQSADIKLSEVNKEIKFADDTKTSKWAEKEVKAMQMAGTLNGRENNNFDPKGTATRAEVSTMLQRFIEMSK